MLKFLKKLFTPRPTPIYHYEGDMLRFDKERVVKIHEAMFTKILRRK